MADRKYNNKFIILHVILFVIITILIISTVASDSTLEAPTSDDTQYIIMGYNIQKYGTFSIDDSDIENPETTAYR